MSVTDFQKQGKKYEGTASEHKRIQEEINRMFCGSRSGKVLKSKEEPPTDDKRQKRNLSPMDAIADEIEYSTTPADSIVGIENTSSKRPYIGDVRQFNLSSTPQTSSPGIFNQS
jgi:hypothetical protein